MSRPSRQIVYQAYGSDKFLKQAVFSLHSLLYWLERESSEHFGGVEVVVYTDSDHWVPQHEAICVRTLTKAQLDEDMGPYRYVHRVKLTVLQDAQRRSDGSILYVDCDTQWIDSPMSAFEKLERTPGLCWMHEYEGDISLTNHSLYLQLLTEGMPFQQHYDCPRPWQMWNAGTIGVSPQAQDFFTEALEISDEAMYRLPYHNWVEQMAVSLNATRRFEVCSFEPYLLHFWRDSVILQPVLERVLSRMGGDVSRDAVYCARFPFEETLLSFRQSLQGRWIRRVAKWRKSLHKRSRFNAGSARHSAG